MQTTKRSKKRQPPPPALPSDAPAPQTPRKGPLSIPKAWAWRLTASYLWVRWLLTIKYGRNVLADAEGAAADKIKAILTFVGLAPASGGPHLGPVLVALWLLLITAFSPIQLLGMFLYITFFPFTVLLVLRYRKALKAGAARTQQSKMATLPGIKRAFPVVPVAITFFVVWFLIFGVASARGPNLIGCIISGIVFLAFVHRALDKTSPIHERDTAAFSRWVEGAILIMRNAAQTAIDSPPRVKFQAVASLWTVRVFIKPFRYVNVFFRGPRGRNRIAMIMLIDYIVFLIVLALSSILFWALMIRTALSPAEAISLTTALGLSASHVLPGISATSPVSLPLWLEFGPALTSWVLFVAYIGPVGSALPVRQEAFLKQITPVFKDFRLVPKLWHLYRNFMQGYVIAFDTSQDLNEGKEPTDGRNP
jgi:hypothetical protein